MSVFRCQFSICCLCLLIWTGMAQHISGYWQGSLPITAKDSLTVGLYIEQGDSLHVELDSPDQYALGIATTDVSFIDSVLKMRMPSISSTFKGVLSADGQRLEGFFTQGKSLPLILERGHERMVINRPQTPQPPFPYNEEEIHLKDKNGRYNLINGTLTLPQQQPKALVIMITGSGWQDRNEMLFAHKPFLVIADHLTREGYAVFRYDDFPKALFAKSTTFDFADGVTLILDSLSRRSDLQQVSIGLLGHSEGSLVAEIVAARDPRIRFIVSLGGVAQEIPDLLLYQLKAINQAEGTMSAQEIENSVVLSKQLYQALLKSKSSEKAIDALNKIWDRQMSALTAEEQARYGITSERKMATIQQLCSPWFYTFFHFSPHTYLKKIQCPVLNLGGEKDLQVDAVTNNELFFKYLPDNSKHQFSVIPNANHLLQTCQTGHPNEYGKIEETIRPEVLKMITDWLNSLLQLSQKERTLFLKVSRFQGI